MPRHDWHCVPCNLMREYVDTLAERLCPSCEKPMVKQPAAPAVAFKGSGWTRPAGWREGA